MKLVTAFIILIAINSNPLFSHGGEKHEKKESAPIVTVSSKTESALKQIGVDYEKKIAPFFKKSCFDCHSSQTNYPWYYKFPIVKQIIDSDIKEGRSHLDFSQGFPFKSHDSPKNDLKSIKKSISEKKMPPQKYLLLHKGAKLSQNEIDIIFDWVTKSLGALE